MPNGVYPVPTSHRNLKGTAGQSRESRPGVGLRLRTWWRRDRLDEQLASGADPDESTELMLRGKQLGDREERARLADALEGAVREASERAAYLRLMVCRAEVRQCADELLALARRLRDDQPINLPGAAKTALLLSDGKSPLYFKRASVPLREAVRSARLALDEAGKASGSRFPTAA
jgi:hypothetical protein